MLLIQVIAFAELFALSMFFSMAESALTSLSPLRMKRISVDRPALRPAFIEWLAHPHRLLTTILIGNNFVNVAASSLSYTMALPLATFIPRRLLAVILWLAVTGVFVVFGEVVPKIVGRTYRERICEWALPILSRLKNGLYWVWGPVGWALDKVAPALRGTPANPLMVTSLEELQAALLQSESQGEVAHDAAEMIRRAVRLPERSAAQIMTPADKVDGLPMDLLSGKRSADLYADILIESGRTRVPVFRKGEAVGYVNVMDFLGAGETPPLESVLRPLRRVPPDMRAPDLLAFFKTTGEPIAAVQEGESFQGLVTLEDVLEEVVGEILDEYDAEKKK